MSTTNRDALKDIRAIAFAQHAPLRISSRTRGRGAGVTPHGTP